MRKPSHRETGTPAKLPLKPPSALVVVLGLVAAFGGSQAASRGSHGPTAQQVAKGALKPPTITTTRNGKTVTRTLPFVSGSTIQSVQDALKVQSGDERFEGADASPDIANSSFSDVGGGQATLGCAKRDSKGNKRVNQDCSFRRQAEEDITYNPADPQNIVGGQNDSRVGYNQCGIDWSTDNGNHWGDLLPPFRQ